MVYNVRIWFEKTTKKHKEGIENIRILAKDNRHAEKLIRDLVDSVNMGKAHQIILEQPRITQFGDESTEEAFIREHSLSNATIEKGYIANSTSHFAALQKYVK